MILKFYKEVNPEKITKEIKPINNLIIGVLSTEGYCEIEFSDDLSAIQKNQIVLIVQNHNKDSN